MVVELGKKTAVVVKSQFTLPEKKGDHRFNDYLNYLDRQEAKSNGDFSSYNDYMDDEKKATSLFSQTDDYLDEEKKEKMKQVFKLAQKRGSILYQDVVSFDNRWLEENGVYDAKTKQVDEKRLKNITRLAMKEMQEKNKLDGNTVWSGAIHHNTDNIHIHIATVDLSPVDHQRGKRKLKTLEGMRSMFVNKINDRSKQHQKINDLIRNRMVNKKKNHKTFTIFNRKFKKDFLSIYNQLPSNKRYWNYGYQNINHVKPALNDLTKRYIDTYFKEEMKQLETKLNKEEKVLKRTYGEGNQARYKDYKKNKINDLYKRMGNAFLSEMREYDKKMKDIEQSSSSTHKTNYNQKNHQTIRKNVAFQQVKYGLDRMVYSELNSYKNQASYERMQRNIERGNSM
ncbi:MobP2 family relaxase [Alteribacillus bidgolensis]|uniref:Uncharacterized protein n=1 Tax=Alteribacillus bidgolensis TaxID=930129 RepID=A0A1G8Q8C5_9BACI|nr:MobP2 family relaxase [Alteribacillus bidgolensis]SDJ00360.1 hypothetical protein SAMN05216352_11819 [Alteribacillus bidgolensis]